MNLLLRGKQNAGFSPRRHAWKSSRGSLKAQQSSWQSLFSAVNEADTMWAMAVPHTQRRGEGKLWVQPGPPLSAAAFEEKLLKHLEGPTLAGEGTAAERAEAELMFCDIPRWPGWLEQEQFEWSWQMLHPSLQRPGKLHTALHCFHITTVKGSWLMMHTALYIAGGVISSLCKAPEKTEMKKEIQKVPLFFGPSQTSSKASLQSNVLKQGFRKSFAEPLPSLHLSPTDQCDDLLTKWGAQPVFQALRQEDEVWQLTKVRG